MARATIEDVRRWEGRTVIDSRGDRIGKIDDVYFDESSARPEWALVNTGMLGHKHNLVPLTKVRSVGADAVQIPYSEEQVQGAPALTSDEELSQEEEQQLYRYYGIDWTQSESSTLLASPAAVPAWGGDDQSNLSRPTQLVRMGPSEAGVKRSH